MIKKGDTVRFLNAVGGGIVTRVDDKSNLVYVEDMDGFEVPVLERECVLMTSINMETNFPVKDFRSKPASSADAHTLNMEPETRNAERETRKEEAIVETPEGEVMNALLAFFPVDIKQLQTTSYECYLVNDSNYYVYYNIINGENDVWKSAAHGTIEPNTQELITEISKEELSEWEHLRVQLLPFKLDKSYTPQQVMDVSLKINAVKFYKLHSFTENDYSDELAMLVNITNAKENQQLADISPEEIKKAMFQKEETGRPRIVKQLHVSDIIEVDLHINELLDSTSGLTNTDMIQFQLAKFHAVLEENKNHKGQKIVFIHGKGEGVLRKEIEKQLKTRYKTYYFQDASFREYGFGATLVTIK